jgi:hypothetical protein
VIDDIRDLYALGAQLVALIGQGSRRTGLENKMPAGTPSPRLMPASVVRFQKGDKLIVPDIEKDVPKQPGFFDP